MALDPRLTRDETPAPVNEARGLAPDERARLLDVLRDVPAPQRIGQFAVIGELGRGGMGAVYEAEQDHPRRRVALKVIRPGLLSRAMLRRFKYEADVLARLAHPGIARVYEAGVADAGAGPQPYFALELVHGRPLDVFVRETNPSTNDRLKLFIAICDAVHHAHTKGVIHRDLKPSNILITGEGHPKVLDFGVARATDSDVQSTTLHTESGQLVGTLPYMAPEQASGKVDELDTSSDVYALGVIAYELLSGRMPYAVDGKPLHEAVRVICTDEPSRLSSINRSLRGDVETIVGKALEKEKFRRYHTAGELAADVKRYLEYEPISARPPGTWYQLSKFARRNKALVFGVTATLIVLLLGCATTTVFWFRESRQRALAEEKRREAEAVVQFLTDDVLAGATPDRIPDKAIRDAIVRVMLDPAAARVAQRFADLPVVQAAVRHQLASCYQVLGRPDLGLPHARTALELRRRALGERNRSTLDSMNKLGSLLRDDGKLTESEHVCRDALDAHRRALGESHAQTVTATANLATVLFDEGKLADAQPLLMDVLEQNRRLHGQDHLETATSEQNVAMLLTARGKNAEAEPHYRHVLAVRRAKLGEEHSNTLLVMSNLAACLQPLGKFAEAEALYRDVLEKRRRVLGADHPDTALSVNNLAVLLNVMGRRDEAEPLYRESLEMHRRLKGEDHPSTLTALGNLAGVLFTQGKYEQSEPMYRDVLARRRRVLGADHRATLESTYGLAVVLRARGNVVEAEPLLRESRDRFAQTLGPDHPNTLLASSQLCSLLFGERRFGDAEPIAAELYARAPSAQIDPKVKARYVGQYGMCLTRLDRHAEAERPILEARQLLVDSGQTRDRLMRDAITLMIEICERTDRAEEAKTWRARLGEWEASTRPDTSRSSG
jgi:tetratricopeptide (TPR) repeat protein